MLAERLGLKSLSGMERADKQFISFKLPNYVRTEQDLGCLGWFPLLLSFGTNASPSVFLGPFENHCAWYFEALNTWDSIPLRRKNRHTNKWNVRRGICLWRNGISPSDRHLRPRYSLLSVGIVKVIRKKQEYNSKEISFPQIKLIPFMLQLCYSFPKFSMLITSVSTSPLML